MAIDPVAVLNAYTSAARAGGSTLAAPSSSPQESEGALSQFGGMLENSVKEAEMQMQTAETMAAKAALGQAELVDVVTAISAAETSLETMLSIRDEVIRAYQDVMKMPI